jgi:hypothetical protein
MDATSKFCRTESAGAMLHISQRTTCAQLHVHNLVICKTKQVRLNVNMIKVKEFTLEQVKQ